MYEYMQYKFIDLMLSKCCSYILQQELQERKMCVNSKWCAIVSLERNFIFCCTIYSLNETLQRKEIHRKEIWLRFIHNNFQTKTPVSNVR